MHCNVASCNVVNSGLDYWNGGIVEKWNGGLDSFVFNNLVMLYLHSVVVSTHNLHYRHTIVQNYYIRS